MDETGRPAFLRPAGLEEALAVLDRLGPRAVPLAGGTDVAVRIRAGAIGATHTLVDLSGLGIDRIAQCPDGLVLGAAVHVADLRASPLVARRAALLGEATAEFGSPQIRARATIGGNLGNASPVADLVPALVALDARLTLTSVAATRTLPVEEFATAPGRTRRRPHELITEVFVPFQRGPGAYERLVFRGQLAIAAASVAVHVELRDGVVAWAGVTAGAVGPRVLRCPRAAQALLGLPVPLDDPRRLDAAVDALSAETSPITDLRASQVYRAATLAGALRVAVGRCLSGLSPARPGDDP